MGINEAMHGLKIVNQVLDTIQIISAVSAGWVAAYILYKIALKIITNVSKIVDMRVKKSKKRQAQEAKDAKGTEQEIEALSKSILSQTKVIDMGARRLLNFFDRYLRKRRYSQGLT